MTDASPPSPSAPDGRPDAPGAIAPTGPAQPSAPSGAGRTGRSADGPPPDSFVARLADREGWYGPPRRAWGPHVRTLLAVALVALLLWGATAAAVNPRGEFPWQPVAPATSEDPAYKRWLLERHGEPDVLVLGSSRSQKVAPADVEAASGLAAFNFALADAYPEDALRVYRGVAGPGGPAEAPAEVVLGLDLNRLEPRGAGSERTRVAFGPLHGDDPAAPDWLRAFGHTYTELYVRQAGGAVLQHLGWAPPGLVEFDADGLAHYRPWERQQAAGTFDQDREIGRYLGRSGYRPFTGLDEGHVAAVRDLVDEARADGATVRVWLTPVHPRLEASYREGNATGYDEALQAARDLLQGLCREGVHAHDYTDLDAFGGRPEWFYDGSHMMRENTQAVVAALYEGRGDLCAA